MAAYAISGFTDEERRRLKTGVVQPDIWSKHISARFVGTTCFNRIATTEHEGEATEVGDAVYIRREPPVTPFVYTPEMVLPVPQRPSAAVSKLNLTLAWGFSTILDDVMKAQSDLLLMDLFADSAIHGIAPLLEENFLDNFHTTVPAANQGASAGVISGNVPLGTSGAPLTVDLDATNPHPVTVLARLAQVLDEAKVPNMDRWAVVPPWFAAQMAQLEIPLGVAQPMAQSTYNGTTGYVGEVARLSIFVSPFVDSNKVLAGYRRGVAVVVQAVISESLKSQMTFGQYVRGLLLAGWKVVEPTGTAIAYVTAG